MKYQTYTKEFIEEMLELNKTISARELGRKYNFHYSNIGYWKKMNIENYKEKLAEEEIINNIKLVPNSYSYILGLYLGDGYINKTARSYRMRIFMDHKYQDLNNYVVKNFNNLFPANKVDKRKVRRANMDIISVYSNNILTLFPQHGRGMKHTREIKLQDWQKEILSPVHFIQGLFHSDGSYYKNSKTTFCFQFTNKSLDIKNLFIDYCKMIDINVTFKNLNYKNIYVYKDSKKLKELIGTKTEVKDIL